MQTKNQNNTPGFTLTELIVVIALLTILVSAIAQIFLSNSRLYETQSGEILSISATRAAADMIADFGRSAVALVDSYTYSGQTYNLGPSAVIFKIPSIDASKNIINGSYDYGIVGAYPANSNRLVAVMAPAAGSSRLARLLEITDHLTAVNFSYDNADSTKIKYVTYDLTVTETGRSPGSEHIYGSVNLRNH